MSPQVLKVSRNCMCPDYVAESQAGEDGDAQRSLRIHTVRNTSGRCHAPCGTPSTLPAPLTCRLGAGSSCCSEPRFGRLPLPGEWRAHGNIEHETDENPNTTNPIPRGS